jgi:quercetin 2,3-dioxygenase
MRPRYQELSSAKIPTATSDGGLVTVRVIAGEALGTRAVIETVTPIIYLHYTLKPGGRITQSVPAEYNAFAYIIDGQGLFGREAEKGTDGQMVMLGSDGDEVFIENKSAEDLDLLLIGGVPLKEPIARYGPFVMNTRQEIYEAIEDYQAGRMGAINF